MKDQVRNSALLAAIEDAAELVDATTDHQGEEVVEVVLAGCADDGIIGTQELTAGCIDTPGVAAGCGFRAHDSAQAGCQTAPEAGCATREAPAAGCVMRAAPAAGCLNSAVDDE